MTIAIGSAGPRPAHGALRVDARDYGLSLNGSADAAPAIQAAHDALSAKMLAVAQASGGNFPTGTVLIPGGNTSYVLGSPLVVSPGINIQGEGNGTALAVGGNHPAIVLGMTKSANIFGHNYAVTTAYRPDLFGKLDTTVATAPGQLAGFRTNGDACIQSQASSLSAGSPSAFGRSYLGGQSVDNWSETTQLTVELIWEPFSQDLINGLGNVRILGTSDSGSVPYPFTFAVPDYGAAPGFRLLVGTQSRRFGPVTETQVNFGTPTGFGIHRMSFQMDLAAGVCVVWDNGVQIATRALPAGCTFAENEYYPFLINASGQNPTDAGATGVDFSVYGFRIARGLYYNVGANGSPQQRIDGQAINDRLRCFDPSGSTVGYLPFNHPSDITTRHVPVACGGSNGSSGSSAWIIHPTVNQHIDFLGPNVISDLAIYGGGMYGYGVMFGAVSNVTIERLRVVNTYYGVGSLNTFATYPVTVRDSDFACMDSGIYAYKAVLNASDVNFSVPGRVAFRVVGSNIDAERLTHFGHPIGNDQCFFQSHENGYDYPISIRKVQVDFEGNTFSRAAMRFERQYGPLETVVRLQDIDLGTIGRTTPFIELDDAFGPSPYGRGRLIVDGMQVVGGSDGQGIDGSAVFATNGPAWTVDARNLTAGTVPHLQHTPIYSPAPTALVRDDHYKAPPRLGSWYAGCHALTVPAPADGQFTEWRCASSGTYGTATPPTWVGLNALAANPGTLAAYVLNTYYLNATLS